MAQKVEAKGGNGGKQWDDGSDNHDVTKIAVRGGREGIQFIKLDYVKDGKSISGPIHGVSGRGITQTFEINHLQKECLVSVEGYYDESTGVIQSLKFKTNKKTSEVMGYDEGTKFSISSHGKKIIGFHGFAEKNLNSLGAYFIRNPSTKSAFQGGITTGNDFDDGGDYDGIRNIYVTFNGDAISHIVVHYDKAGHVETRQHGYKTGTEYEFAVNHPYEYITSVEATYAVAKPYNCDIITSLTFKTSKGRTSPTIGKVSPSKFVLENEGSAIVGFHGREGGYIDAIGAYYNSLPPSPPLLHKLEVQGGNGGNEWDDGSDNDDVTKIQVQGGREGIQFIKFDYVKDGKSVVGPIHGVSGRGMTETFEINHLQKECLLSVEGYYNKSTGVIQSLQFKTNMKTSELMGYDEGTKFSLSVYRKKIIGFHGFSEKNLNSLGAYFITNPSTKSAIEGGKLSGTNFDDGGDYDGIKKVYVTFDGDAIRHLKIDYDNAGQVQTRERGKKIGTEYEFAINYPSEYLTSVEATYAVVNPYKVIVLTSLLFKTSKGRTSPTIGKVSPSKFVLENERSAIVGFHGRVGHCIDGMGAYYTFPPPSLASSEKLQGKGGDEGDAWDDGAFQNVKKVYVGQGDVGIVSVKFEYENETSEVIVGEEHGKKTLLGYEEFELDSPSEYILAVEACYDKVFGAKSEVITMLKFRTNKRTSQPFGLESTSNFILQKEGHKIIGFHGKSGNQLHQIGVHVVPI